jgi:hypothetical protein
VLPAGATGAVDLRAVVPSLTPDVWRSTTTPAQRVIRHATVAVTAHADLQPAATTTTVPPTTTTPAPAAAPTTTSTTAPPATAPSTTPPPPPPAPTPVPTVVTAPTTLPRTGTDPLGLAVGGLGLTLLGVALVDLSPRPGRPR